MRFSESEAADRVVPLNMSPTEARVVADALHDTILRSEDPETVARVTFAHRRLTRALARWEAVQAEVEALWPTKEA